MVCSELRGRCDTILQRRVTVKQECYPLRRRDISEILIREACHDADHAVLLRLPNEAARKRMAALVDSFAPTPPPGPPPEVKLAPEVLDRYVGEYTSASGFTAIFRREGDKLIVKPGKNPEATLIGRSQTRLQDPRGPVFEFEVDAQGKVTRAFLEQNTPKGLTKMALERK